MDWELYASSGLAVISSIKRRTNSPCMACENDPFERKVQNITIFRSHLSKLTKMVIGSVLNSNTKEECSQKVDKFHQLALSLVEMNNFSSCSAVMDGLHSIYVRSLKVTTVSRF
jgi:hypothetical protein